MGLFDSYATSDSNSRFLKAFEALARAATTAADAYAKKTEGEVSPKYIVTINVNGDSPAEDVATRIDAALRAQRNRVQDR